MTMDIAPDKAELVALWCETLLYGVYLTYFQRSFRVIILNQRRRGTRNWWHAVGSFGIFLFATTHLFLVFARAIQAFTIFRDEPGPVAYYFNLRNGLEVSQASSQVAVTFFGDCMAIWRVWIVYNRRWLPVIVPLLCLAGTTTAGIVSVVYIGKASSPDSSTIFYIPKLEIWLPAFFGMTFGTSILSTILISVRLFLAQQRAKKHSTKETASQFTSILRILIESASMYSGMMLLYLATYLGKTNYNIIFGDMVAPVLGIAFSLITLRVRDTFDHGPTSSTSPQSMHMSAVRFADHSRRTAAATESTLHGDEQEKHCNTIGTPPMSPGTLVDETDRNSSELA